MCAICGILGTAPVGPEQVKRMTDLLQHRGPDDEGVFTAGNLGLGHRRLAILDLSPQGHQPMSTRDRNLWITYNGEVYNYLELRNELRRFGHRFASATDTEVILAAYAEWGPACVKRFNGMWAFAIWDQRERTLFCSRDRFGIKPLYYLFEGGTFAFASEIKPLLGLLSARKLNEELANDFLECGVLDHRAETFLAGIHKLPPAHNLEFRAGKLTLSRYWDFTVSRDYEDRRTDREHAEQLHGLFTDAVRLRLRSDVPVGSCLSGGLDSSSIVCVMQRLLERNGESRPGGPLQTFSACFEEKEVDERHYITEVVTQTGAESSLVFPRPEGFRKELEHLIYHQEEPFGGMSIYSQRCVFRQAGQAAVKVLLDGQGSDEVLLGYRKYYLLHYAELLKAGRVVRFVREAMPFLLSCEVLRSTEFKSGLHYLPGLARALSLHGLFKRSRSSFKLARDYFQLLKEDVLQNSIPVLLRYEDKNSMTYAVETRLPFLDHRLVEAVAAMPLSQKLRRGWTKYVLRNAMRGILPRRIETRKSKLGFSVPEESWIRNECRSDFQLTFEDACFLPQFVNMDVLNQRFERFLEGRSLLPGAFFFRFFIFERWARAFLP